MHGKIITIHGGGSITTEEIDTPRVLSNLQKAVGGTICSVPYFDHINCEGERRKCWAVCHDEGILIGLPLNPHFTAIYWREVPEMAEQQYIFGPVAIVIGDDELLAEL